jgi:hypothetical protein
MIADPEGPSFITRTVGRRQYTDDAFVSHDPAETLARALRSNRAKDALGQGFWSTASLARDASDREAIA